MVDSEWTTDHTAPQEKDESGNINNVLLPEQITGPHSSDHHLTGAMSGVTPQSTTVGLAAKVPKESDREAHEIRPGSASSDVPGSFPETPFHDANEFAVDPIPATSGTGNPVRLQPGDNVPHPNTLTDNTISSTVKDDPSLKGNTKGSEQNVGVAPLPATSGIGNPISLQAGEKVPHPSTFTDNTIDSHVTTDQASYENAGINGSTPTSKAGGAQRDISSMPPVIGTMIPESSLPMGKGAIASDPGFTIQSSGANSTTAALAGDVPLESRGIPTVVAESQQEAGAAAEASANPEAVKEKSAVEKELEKKVPEEPATSESTGSKDAALAAGGAAVGAGVGAAAMAGSGSKGLPSSIQHSIDEMNKGSTGTPIASTVPDVVQQSMSESNVSPEAAGDKAKVGEKNAMEQELLSEVKKETDVGEPAPSSSAALTETAPSATGSKGATSQDIVPPREETPSKDAAPVTTAAAPAQTPAAQNAMKKAVQSQPDSRDISPMSKPTNGSQAQPTVTTGLGSTSTPAKSETPAQSATTSKASPVSTSSAATTDKKSKRSSGFFGKLKSKFSDKDKK